MSPTATSRTVATEIVTDPTVMSGEPVVRGTRILAETIVSYLKEGASAEEIFRDYPSLPIDGIEAVLKWVEHVHGADWQNAKPSAPAH